MSASRRDWTYEHRNPHHGGAPKHKRGWDRDDAGFVGRDEGLVGKCPDDMTLDEAEALLNEGIPVPDPAEDGEEPENIYAVHDGVVYRAVVTRRGHSYHGFPAGAQREVLPPTDEKILEQAREKDCETEVRRWMDEHMEVPGL